MKTAKEINEMFIEQERENIRIKNEKYEVEKAYLASQKYAEECLSKAEALSEDAIDKLIKECERSMKSRGTTNNCYIYVHCYSSEKICKLSKDILNKLGYRTGDIQYSPYRERDECADDEENWCFKLNK